MHAKFESMHTKFENMHAKFEECPLKFEKIYLAAKLSAIHVKALYMCPGL